MKFLFYFFIITFTCAGVYLNFIQFHEDIPSGCDEFGYMYQAKAMDEHKTFESHTQRPYLKGLLDTLRKEHIPEFEINYFVAPLAYYVIPNTAKIINMYPPATAYVLSLFRIEHRKMIFPLLVVFLFLIIPIMLINIKGERSYNWFDLSLMLFIVLMIQLFPFRTELTRINSLGLTLGLLLGAGMMVKSKPLWSCVFIALSANFRPVNLLLLLPLIAFVDYKSIFSEGTQKAIIKGGKLFLKYTLVVILCTLPYFIYVYLLLGNPFMPTYSSFDIAIAESKLTNFLFYININQRWFIFHLLLLSILGWLVYRKRISRGFFICLVLFPVLNYFYFITKSIKMNYYPYASAMIMLGVCFNEFGKIPLALNKTKAIVISSLAIAIIIFAGGVYEYVSKKHVAYEEAKEKYKPMCNFDIVWGDEYAGTSEYVCGNSGFTFFRTMPRARKIAFNYLRNHNYSQAILLHDNILMEAKEINKKIIVDEIIALQLNYKVVNDDFLGEILIIDNKQQTTDNSSQAIGVNTFAAVK